LIERKSRFVGYVSHASSEDEARKYIDTIRQLHPEANHHVWCYVLNRGATVKASDDGEPSGTAGRPVLEVILREGLSDVVCVVVRYFGGILLGAGGLIRAYASGAKLALNEASVVEMVPMEKLQVTVPYHFYGKIGSFLQKEGISAENPEYSENVSFIIILTPKKTEYYTKAFMDMTSGKALVEKCETLLMPEK